ncbi:MAG TPA: hypothetical protein VMF88_09210 [Bacteroidota bacterium]|nr:hypothetical protein [Bacteroidota bacterium]
MDPNLYNLLLRSFDSKLRESDQRRLDDGLASSEDLRRARNDIATLRRRLGEMKEPSFKPFFAERVVQRLGRVESSLMEQYLSVFRSVAIGAAVLVIICGAYNISRDNSVSFDSALGFPHQTLEQILALEPPLE